MPSHDEAVTGAGILGLAHTHQLARRGRRVVVFERDPVAQGASIPDFGLIWPIRPPAGARRELARRSAPEWRDVLSSSGTWQDGVGSLHLAYH